MKVISNRDYTTTKRLLHQMAASKGASLREKNAARQAQQLLRKWARNESR